MKVSFLNPHQNTFGSQKLNSGDRVSNRGALLQSKLPMPTHFTCPSRTTQKCKFNTAPQPSTLHRPDARSSCVRASQRSRDGRISSILSRCAPGRRPRTATAAGRVACARWGKEEEEVVERGRRGRQVPSFHSLLRSFTHSCLLAKWPNNTLCTVHLKVLCH